MIVTEEEAKTKWCPFARVGNATGCNRYPMEHDAYKGVAFAKCLGSACMSWRWHHKRAEREDHNGARGVMLNEAVKTGRIMRREGPPGSLGILILDGVGYCGLAGKMDEG